MIEQKESIKLIKGAKGYRWEIKILSNALGMGKELERLELIDKDMREKYGQTNE